MRRHVLSGYVNRGRRGEQGTCGLLVQIAVSALHISLSNGVAGGSIQPKGAGGGDQTLIRDGG